MPVRLLRVGGTGPVNLFPSRRLASNDGTRFNVEGMLPLKLLL
ncbi:hypothetical protein DsansV1_C18g0153271 [Dioscorea sansibarensis]